MIELIPHNLNFSIPLLFQKKIQFFVFCSPLAVGFLNFSTDKHLEMGLVILDEMRQFGILGMKYSEVTYMAKRRNLFRLTLLLQFRNRHITAVSKTGGSQVGEK